MRADRHLRVPGAAARIRAIATRARDRLRSAPSAASRPTDHPSPTTYQQRVAAEHEHFDGCEQVHALPPIFHYWSNRYLRPKLEQTCGASHPDAFFARYLAECYAHGSGRRRFMSIGAGNCDTEVRVARALLDAGCDRFAIECLELNPEMLARGQRLADDELLAGRIVPRQGDCNAWAPDGVYDGIIANQSLHHIVELERLFDSIAAALTAHAAFIASDTIGRNGHQRWPEALAIVREFWRELPPSYRYNRQLMRQEDEFLDWDCASEGFEGIRAQDVLPLLVERFGFDAFIGFGNVIDPFIDRGFGPNFSVAAGWDRDFIDRVHARDETELAAGRIKPTHMFAVMRPIGGCEPFAGSAAARAAIRPPDDRHADEKP